MEHAGRGHKDAGADDDPDDDADAVQEAEFSLNSGRVSCRIELGPDRTATEICRYSLVEINRWFILPPVGSPIKCESWRTDSFLWDRMCPLVHVFLANLTHFMGEPPEGKGREKEPHNITHSLT